MIAIHSTVRMPIPYRFKSARSAGAVDECCVDVATCSRRVSAALADDDSSRRCRSYSDVRPPSAEVPARAINASTSVFKGCGNSCKFGTTFLRPTCAAECDACGALVDDEDEDDGRGKVTFAGSEEAEVEVGARTIGAHSDEDEAEDDDVGADDGRKRRCCAADNEYDDGMKNALLLGAYDAVDGKVDVACA